MFLYSGIKAYHEQLLRKETDCLKTVTHYLSRIKEHKNLNAFIEVFEEKALQQAASLDKKRNAGKPIGKLHGVVISIKDVICYKDHKVSAASRILEGFTSLYTASSLQCLLDEEAIIIGRCNCDEFAMGSTNENSAYGPALNGIDPGLVPGGSSGGSAVSVQAGLCMVALGSDTGGSVRQPADFCGIIGFKPGYGSFSRYGLIAYASSFDQVGVMGKFIEDVALVSSLMNRTDAFDATMDQTERVIPEVIAERKTPFRFCYFKQMIAHPSLDPEIRTSLLSLIDDLKSRGHVVEEADFNLIDYIVPAYYLLTTAEASSNLSRYDGIRYGYRGQNADTLSDFYAENRTKAFGKEVKRRIMLGNFVLSAGYYDTYYAKAQKVRRLLCKQITDVFSRYDAVLLPCSPGTAFRLGETRKDPVAVYLADIFTVFANLTGIPAISVPLFTHSNGMPFSVQVMADKKQEETLLQAARFLETLKNAD